MDRQRSTRWAASLYSAEEVSGEGVSGEPVRTCLEPVSLSQHSLHKGESPHEPKHMRMDRQHSTRWAASLSSAEDMSGKRWASGKAVKPCLAAVRLSQHSLHVTQRASAGVQH